MKRKLRQKVNGSSTYQIGPGTAVVVSYTLFDEDGEEVAASAPEGLAFVFGFGEVPRAIEEALEGAAKGQQRAAVLQPTDAFGERDPEEVLEVERTEIPADAAVGDRFVAEAEDGRPVYLTVLDLTDEWAALDANHPLAGQEIRVELEVDDVRPATSEELERSQAHLDARSGAPAPLIPPERLLRAPNRS